ncbi:Transcription factor bHLH90, partial [Linum grandiflorum]
GTNSLSLLSLSPIHLLRLSHFSVLPLHLFFFFFFICQLLPYKSEFCCNFPTTGAEEMAGGLEMESVIALLRPIVDCRAWDYCVVWKLTPVPSRFLEWIGCCCSGAKDAKQEDAEDAIGPFCRDVSSKHRIGSMACLALARFPSFMPLYPGVHGAVAISSQYSWIHCDAQNHFELGGTRVLIPVYEDDRIVDLIVTHCNTLLYGMIMKEQNLVTSNLNEFEGLLQSPSCSSSSLFKRSSSISIPSNVYPLLDRSYSALSASASASSSKAPQLTDNSVNTKVAKSNEKPTRNRPTSKNLITERNRRNKIQQRLFALRSLVPKISKMDKASIIGDAVDYIIELQNERKKLEEELDQLEEQEAEQTKNISSNLPTAVVVKTEMIEVDLDVITIGPKEFLIRLLHQQRKGGLVKLMETLSSLGLEVLDANITNLHGNVLNILRVRGNEVITQRKLRDRLVMLI